jgi:pilus assembly protein Flp/PilA
MLTKLYIRAQGWLRDDEGATAAEYGLLVALIALIIVIGVGAFGGALNAFFQKIAGTVGGW